MTTYKLAQGWTKLQLAPNLPVFYNFHTQVFSLAPVMSMADFLILACTILPQGQNLSTEDLQSKISSLEVQIKEKNNGILPPLENLSQKLLADPALTLNQQQQPALGNPNQPKSSQPQAFESKEYHTTKEISQIKSLQSGQEVISALSAITRSEFQLDPSFHQEDRGNNCDQSNQRFITVCQFYSTKICSALGSNKKEGKSKCAKLALFKTAPTIYNAMYGDEKPPDDFSQQQNLNSNSANEKPAQSNDCNWVADNLVSLAMPQLLDANDKSKLFATYQIWQLFKIYIQTSGWSYTENDRTNPHQECNGKREQSKIYVIEVYDDQKVLQNREKTMVPNNVTGRKRCAVTILTQMFGKDKKWLELVDYVSQLVNSNRQKRGCPDKPVIKKLTTYIQEQNEAKPQTTIACSTNANSGLQAQKMSQQENQNSLQSPLPTNNLQKYDSPLKKRTNQEMSQSNQEEVKEGPVALKDLSLYSGNIKQSINQQEKSKKPAKRVLFENQKQQQSWNSESKVTNKFFTNQQHIDCIDLSD